MLHPPLRHLHSSIPLAQDLTYKTSDLRPQCLEQTQLTFIHSTGACCIRGSCRAEISIGISMVLEIEEGTSPVIKIISGRIHMLI